MKNIRGKREIALVTAGVMLGAALRLSKSVELNVKKKLDIGANL